MHLATRIALPLVLILVTLSETTAAQPYGGMMGPRMMSQGMMSPGMMGSPQPVPTKPTASGAQIFQQQCAMCHVDRAGAQSTVGPNLYGIFGRKSGSLPGYAYSSAMRNAGVVWSERTLSQFLAAPRRFIPGTTMAYPGISDEKVRQTLIEYLKSETR